MKTLMPTSLAGRLLMGAAAFTLVALVVALLLMNLVLHRFVTGQIDQRLDNKIVALMSQTRVAADGTVSLDGAGDGPPFDRPEHGSFWEIVGPRNTLRTRWLGERSLQPLPSAMPSATQHPVSWDGPGPDGSEVHVRLREQTMDGVTVVILAAAPIAAIDGPMREALTTIGLCLALLGAALVAATVLQVRFGLRPLRRLQAEIAAVRTGHAVRLAEDQPREVLPLVSEMNVLLEQQAANLVRARQHVANLAHGLKTPLATLALAVERTPPAQREGLQILVGLIDHRIRHHLGRARVAALNGTMRSQTALAAHLRDLTDVMMKLHVDKALHLVLACPADLVVACEPQDIDEILGNLLENAFKWTRSAIRCRAEPAGPMVRVTIEDDGPGLATQDVQHVLRPGQRLDETVPGFGFGLSIARELIELYAGTLTLEAGNPGLIVTLTLPRVVR